MTSRPARPGRSLLWLVLAGCGAVDPSAGSDGGLGASDGGGEDVAGDAGGAAGGDSAAGTCTASAPAHGAVDDPTVARGASARYACAAGFALAGAAPTCSATGWSGPEPTCAPITCGATAPAHGTVNGARASIVVGHGAAPAYACDAGFALAGVAPVCGGITNPGTLGGPEPTCQAIICQAHPPAHGRVGGGTAAVPVAWGAAAAYDCEDGYILVGAPPSCGGTSNPGTLAGAEPACATVACAVHAPANGTVNGGAGTSHVAAGDAGHYACAPGFALVGGAPTCTGTSNPGALDGAEPSCTAITCTATAPAHGTVGGGAGPVFVPHGGAAQYACDGGYVLMGAAPACGGTTNPGTLGPEPTCELIACTAHAPADGTVNGGTVPVPLGFGGSASYACDAGHVLSGSAPVCDGGTFGPEPSCLPITCTAHAPTSGTVNGGTAPVSVAHGTAAAYACAAGFTLTGTAPTCTGSGNPGVLSGAEPTCTAITCTAHAPAQGTVAGGTAPVEVPHGQSASYACLPNYALTGTAPVCGGSGNPGAFAGPEPFCLPRNCRATAPAHGTINAGADPVALAPGTAGTYACDLGYSLSGSAPLCAGGALDGPSPTCLASCTAHAPAGGTVNGGTTPISVPHAGSATYGCTAAGYAPSSAAPTCSNGVFSGAEPTCAPAVVSFDAGDRYTCAVTSDGGLWCWGRNDSGQLGDASTYVPANDLSNHALRVSDGTGPFTGATAVSTGPIHACALKDDGTVWCWGWAINGQLGNGTTTPDVRFAVQVLAAAATPFTGAVQIAVGTGTSLFPPATHTCAVKTDGTVWCWGAGSNGRLGNGGTAQAVYPVQVNDALGALAGVTQVAAGSTQTCARKGDGTVWCWGQAGRTGDGTNTQRTTAVQVTVSGGAFLTGVRSISAGNSHTCANKTDDTVWCWGNGANGRLGNNGTASSLFAVQALASAGNPFTGAASVAAGDAHTCAHKNDGTVWCWGFNSEGQLGYSGGSTLLPVQVTDGANPVSGVSAVASGVTHTCALETDKVLWCWGGNTLGQLHQRGANYVPEATQVALTSAASVATGSGIACAVKTDGTTWCWGSDGNGGLGDGPTNSSGPTPVQVVDGTGPLTGAVQASMGYFGGGCVRKTDGSVWCWGYNGQGQLGNNGTTASDVAVQVTDGVNPFLDVAEVSYGHWHVCARKNDGTAWCWGRDHEQELGNGAGGETHVPGQVQTAGGPLTSVAQISAGVDYSCAVLTDGSVWCWGYNGISLATEVSPGGAGFTDVTAVSINSAYTPHACVLESDQSVWCWGSNGSGELGNDSFVASATPVQVTDGTSPLGNVVSLPGSRDINQSTLCAIKGDGSLWCWGWNYSGGVGNGSFHDSSVAVRVTDGTAPLANVVQVSPNYRTTCAVKSDHTVWCWGDNTSSQVGMPSVFPYALRSFPR